MASTRKIVGLIIAVGVLVYVFQVKMREHPESDGNQIVKADAPAAEDIKNMGMLVSALNHQDEAGLDALLRDGRVVILPRGSQVYILAESNGAVAVNVESGALIGKSLWVLPQFLERANEPR